MRKISSEEMQFRHCSLLLKRSVADGTKRGRTGQCLCLVSFLMLFIPLLLFHVVPSIANSSTWPFLQNIGITGLFLLGVGMFWCVVLRRIRCPSCGNKVELRSHRTGKSSEEIVIGICTKCKIQAELGFLSSA